MNATPEQRAAAARLGTAYLIATAIGGRVDREAIPSAPRNGSLRPAMLAALGKVYGSDDERSRQPGPYRNRYALYKADYDVVKPLVETTMRRWTSAALTAELVQFAILTSRLKMPAVGSDLHLRAERVGVAAGGYDPRADEIDAVYGNARARQSTNPSLGSGARAPCRRVRPAAAGGTSAALGPGTRGPGGGAGEGRDPLYPLRPPTPGSTSWPSTGPGPQPGSEPLAGT